MDVIEGFILSELEQHGIPYRNAARDVKVMCPFHQHSNTKFHLGIRRLDGVLHCWSCHATGTWNKYAEKLGLRKFDRKRIEADMTAGSISTIIAQAFRYEDDAPRMPPGAFPWSGDWRGIEEDLLLSLDAYCWYDLPSEADRILWPVTMGGRGYGWMAAVVDPLSPAQPKTRSLQGFRAANGLWPYDHPVVADSDVLMIVEGQYDAVRAIQHGIPTVCCFGTANWNRTKAARILGRRYRHVLLAMDGDQPGRMAVEAALADLAHEIRTDVLEWPTPPRGFVDQFGRPQAGYDPGNCPHDFFDSMKEILGMVRR